MRGHIRYIRLLLCVFAGCIFAPTITSACGGFFCTTTPIDQGAERIIFTINDDDTITAIVGINYVGAAADFSWVVPVPSPPTVDVAEASSLNMLELATAVRVNNPPRYCDGIFPEPCCFGGGGGDGYLAEGNAGPYDYAIIRNENPGEMIAWLRDNDYRVAPEMEPLIEVYVEEGMYFLAMKLKQDRDIGDIQPVVMTYESTEPMIPIRLTAVAAIEDMPILTWIFADAQYVPENYVHPWLDFSGFRAPGEVATDSFGNLFFSNGNSLYQAERDRIQDRYNGLAFITEYAGLSENLAPQAQDDPLIGRLIERFPYLTRLRGQMSPEQMTVDPMFRPAPNMPDVSNIVNLVDYVDPLEYWGCSSRTALTEEAVAHLPGGRTRVDSLQFEVAHPDGWILSEFDVGEQHFGAFAPESMNADTIAAFFAGEDTVPILVFTEINEFIWGAFEGNDSNTHNLLERLNQPFDDAFITESEQRNLVRVRYWPIGGYGEYDGLRAVLFGILASPAQWTTDGNLYDSMLDYADSYQYFASADLQNTLFLSSSVHYETDVVIPYPDEWKEQVNSADGDILIMPADTDSPESGPVMRLTSILRFEVHDDNGDRISWGVEEAQQWMVAQFGLPLEDIMSYLTVETYLNCNPATHTPPIPFEHDGRSGYVRFMNDYIVSASAPTPDFGQYEDTLLKMLEGIEFVDCG